MSNLCLHRDCGSVSREALALYAPPEMTRTYKPVSHIDVANLVVEEANKRGLTVEDESHGLSPKGDKMFGVLRLANSNRPDYARAIGIRNSYNKTLAFGICAGANVFVCDNLAFNGKYTVLHKHIMSLEITELVPGAFDSLANDFGVMEERLEAMKTVKLEIDCAKLEIFRAAQAGCIPSEDILRVYKEYTEPKYEEFRERTRWSLFNSFTETFKKYTPMARQARHKALAKFYLA